MLIILKRVIKFLEGMNSDDRKIEHVIIDANMLSYHYDETNLRMQRYYEGFSKSNGPGKDNFPKRLRYYSCQQLIEIATNDHLNGEFAFITATAGVSVYLCARIIAESQRSTQVHVFDFFEGEIPEKRPEDANQRFELSDERSEFENRVMRNSEKEVQNLLAEFDFVRTYKGQIPDRFHEVENINFCCVIIGHVRYHAVLESLKFFYPRLLNNGVMNIEDYGFTQYPGVKRATDEFLLTNTPQLFYEHQMGGAFLIK